MHLYSAKSRNAANALNRQSHCKPECLQFMSECFDWNVWGSKVSRKTVPCSTSLYGETAVAVIRPASWNSQSTRVHGSTLVADGRWQIKVLHLVQLVIELNVGLQWFTLIGENVGILSSSPVSLMDHPWAYVCQMITFENLDVEGSFSLIWYISSWVDTGHNCKFVNGHQVKVTVKEQNDPKSLFP